MFHRILVPIDLGAEASWKAALPQAIELAKVSNATIHLLSVVVDAGTPLVESFFPADFAERALAHAEKELAALAEREIGDRVRHEQHLAIGSPYRKILDAIEQTGCDLVVMASHDPDATRDFLLGTNADRVVRRAPVSVLVVRA